MAGLWNNQSIKHALKNMTSAEREKYKRFSDNMFNVVDIKERKVIQKMEPPLRESVKYVVEGLNSGLHPKYLLEKEVEVLYKYYGEKWYTRWGFKQSDIPEKKHISMK